VAVMDVKMSLHYRSRLYVNLSSVVRGSGNGLTAAVAGQHHRPLEGQTFTLRAG